MADEMAPDTDGSPSTGKQFDYHVHARFADPAFEVARGTISRRLYPSPEEALKDMRNRRNITPSGSKALLEINEDTSSSPPGKPQSSLLTMQQHTESYS